LDIFKNCHHSEPKGSARQNVQKVAKELIKEWVWDIAYVLFIGLDKHMNIVYKQTDVITNELQLNHSILIIYVNEFQIDNAIIKCEVLVVYQLFT